MQELQKRYRQIFTPRLGETYSVVLDGVRQLVRMETKLSTKEWIVNVVESGAQYVINPKNLETAEPVAVPAPKKDKKKRKNQ
jgi:hypothetical protein